MFNDFFAILPYFVRCIGCWPGSEVIDLPNRYSLDPGDTCECLGLKCRCSKRKTVAPGLKRGWQEPKRKMHKNAGSHWKFASTKGDHRLKSYGCLDADLPLPRSGEDMSHMHYLHHIYWYLLYCINLGLFSIYFHPCPCLQEAFRPTSSHPKFFPSHLPHKTWSRGSNSFQTPVGLDPKLGQEPLQFLKHKRGFERGKLPGKNGGFMRCGDINYYLGILGLRFGRFLGGKPLKSDYTITPHNGSHTPAYNWNCDLKDDDEPWFACIAWYCICFFLPYGFGRKSDCSQLQTGGWPTSLEFLKMSFHFPNGKSTFFSCGILWNI